MSILSVFTLFGGLAFFLYGMHIMSSGLEKIAGGKLEKILKQMTSNPLKGLLLGMGVTIAIQSSSAMTVMLVGLVNSGIMELGQTIGIIMGSNIGTTLTAWILSLSGIQSDSLLIQLLNPNSFAPIVAMVGVLLMMLAKSKRKKDIGNIMLGFAILMYGMNIMGEAVSPLAEMPGFKDVLVAFNNPILGILAGTIVTGIIQSSAASIGILQALSLTGTITYGIAIPIIMGQNIGTCATALLSSIGVNRNAKRVALIHVYFNVIGTIICMILFFGLDSIMHFTFINEAISPVGIAGVHTVFNLFTTLCLLPFSKYLEYLAKLAIKPSKEGEERPLLDIRLLNTPSIAIAECRESTIKMSNLVKENVEAATRLIENFSNKEVDLIDKKELLIDKYQDQLGTYLVKLSSKELSEEDSKEVSKILHLLGDLERIGDHAKGLSSSIEELHHKPFVFSDEARKELNVIVEAIKEIIEVTMKAYVNNDIALAKEVEPLEQVIDWLKLEIKERHIQRLQEGNCTIEQGMIFMDMLTNFERISDHCSNIAVCIIEVNESSFDTHRYLHEVKHSLSGDFVNSYEKIKARYETRLIEGY